MTNSSQRQVQGTLQLLFVGLLLAGSYWILQPFLLALSWATIIVVATWPLLLRAQSRLWNKRWLAVSLTIPVSLLSFIAPVSLAVVMIAEHATEIVDGAKALVALATTPPPLWVERIPVVGSKVAAEWRSLAAGGPESVAAHILPFVDTIVAWFVSKAGGLGVLVIQLLLTSIIAAILYLNGEIAAAAVHRVAWRLGGTRGENTVRLAVQTIRGVALGVIGTAFIQSAFAGIGLAVAGVPYAAILTAVMLVLGLVQAGPVPVLVPAVIWLYWDGRAGWGTLLVVWTVVAATMDNFLRPMLIQRVVDLPVLLIAAGVIGGLIAFGAIGLFVGPVVLAVSYTSLVSWIQSDDPEPVPSA